MKEGAWSYPETICIAPLIAPKAFLFFSWGPFLAHCGENLNLGPLQSDSFPTCDGILTSKSSKLPGALCKVTILQKSLPLLCSTWRKLFSGSGLLGLIFDLVLSFLSSTFPPPALPASVGLFSAEGWENTKAFRGRWGWDQGGSLASACHCLLNLSGLVHLWL